jgi:hypothetical protein
MNNKKFSHNLPEDFPGGDPFSPEAMKDYVLVSKDKSGTEYYAPKDLTKIDRDLKVEYAKGWHRRVLAHHWRQIWFEVRMFLDVIRWYLEIKIKG